MINAMLVASFIIIAAMFSTKLSQKIGIPSLLLFIALGLLFGRDGIFKLEFENYQLVENICSISLVFIIFYGGFGTRWKTAKPVAVKAIMLSTLGVFLTAAFVGMFCYLVLKMGLMESLLIGAIISSTDAASVFSILKSKRLALKNQSAPLLELESGSNDPTAYMLTIIILEIMNKPATYDKYILMIITQFLVGILAALILSKLTLFIIKKFKLESNELSIIFYVGMILLTYALSTKGGGNGYLSIYIFGIILGNQYIKNKNVIINFFDGITALVQIGVFFLLGLLALPSKMPEIMLISLFIALFLTFVARPIASFILLKPFKCSMNQIALISFAGIRGASAIVFAIIATISVSNIKYDIFHIVFCIVLFSIAFQGSLLPFVSKKLKMIDKNGDVLKTFTDYQEENEVQFIRLHINKNHPWNRFKIKNIILPPEVLILMIIRDGDKIIPNGNTLIDEEDILIIAAPGVNDNNNIILNEVLITKDHDWIKKEIRDIQMNPDNLIAIIKRGKKVIIPRGNTLIMEGDIVVLLNNTP